MQKSETKWFLGEKSISVSSLELLVSMVGKLAPDLFLEPIWTVSHTVSKWQFRLLHSPNTAAVGLSVGSGSGTWDITSSVPAHVSLNLDWDGYSSSAFWVHWNALWAYHMWLVGFLPFFHDYFTALCTAPWAGKCLPLGLCKQSVKQFSSNFQWGMVAINIIQWQNTIGAIH